MCFAEHVSCREVPSLHKDCFHYCSSANVAYACLSASENKPFKFLFSFVRLLDEPPVNATRAWHESPGMSKSSLAKAHVFS